MYNEVVFDLETKRLFNEIKGNDPGKLGVSVVSLYSRVLDENFNEVEGKTKSFWENEFGQMWPLFQGADRIIGFNSIGFDVPALIPYSNFPFQKLPHFDILTKVKESFGHRISLDHIAMETLQKHKIDVGTNAVIYWKNHDEQSLEKLRRYCEDDVIITRDVYDFGLKHGFIRFKDKWNSLREIDIDFSYPKEDSSKKQIGLF
jgi:DEAD/DEAH box helicase domain-containing protein